jgi:membrane complex biogenesis BtpA family protein
MFMTRARRYYNAQHGDGQTKTLSAANDHAVADRREHDGPENVVTASEPIRRFRDCFRAPRALIGMIHVGALPGTPASRDPIDAIISRAAAEARVYRDAGFSAVAIENMHDRPYLKGQVGPEITAAMAVIGYEVKRECRLPLGIQVLAAANREALAAAHACGADFVRVEGFVFAHVADEGFIESAAGDLLRYRRTIGAEHILVLADIKKKHGAHAITADVSLADTAKAAELFLADGVVVTGSATGEETSDADVACVTASTTLPVFVGSGLTPANLARFASAHGYIVGSSVKEEGSWDHPLDRRRAEAMASAFAALHSRS